METKTTYTIYGEVEMEHKSPYKMPLLTFDKHHEFDNFRISYKFYETALTRFLAEYGYYPKFPEMRDIFDESDNMRDEQKIITGNDEFAILQIKDFVNTISNLWDESTYSTIENISFFTAKRKIVTIEYYEEEL